MCIVGNRLGSARQNLDGIERRGIFERRDELLVAAVDGKGSPNREDRVTTVVVVEEDVRELIPRRGVLRIMLRGAPVHIDRLLRLVLMRVNLAERVIDLRRPAPIAERRPELVGGLVVPSGAAQDLRQ